MKLLEQVRHAARVKHYAIRTEDAYAYWIERYLCFHGIRHPNSRVPKVAFATWGYRRQTEGIGKMCQKP